MGDRANVYVMETWQNSGAERPGVYLYTHWDGSALPWILQQALKRQQRWKDIQYLTRIIFCEMLKRSSDGLDGETGYGISAEVGDGDDRILVVDVGKQTVSVKNGGTWSFDDYIKVPDFHGVWSND